jgi:hypothetical protein
VVVFIQHPPDKILVDLNAEGIGVDSKGSSPKSRKERACHLLVCIKYGADKHHASPD